MVKFVDYGNEVQCYRSQLRKDLVGLDTQVLSLSVELSNVQLTNGYESHTVYDKLANVEVDVELTEFPKTMPMKCKLHFGQKVTAYLSTPFYGKINSKLLTLKSLLSDLV